MVGDAHPTVLSYLSLRPLCPLRFYKQGLRKIWFKTL